MRAGKVEGTLEAMRVERSRKVPIGRLDRNSRSVTCLRRARHKRLGKYQARVVSWCGEQTRISSIDAIAHRNRI